MKPYAEEFYKSQAWKSCRQAYMSMAAGLCEDCLKEGRYTAAEIIHHRVPITEENISDPSITLDFNNLKAVCRVCHAKAHGGRQRRYIVDEMGRVTIK